MSRRRLGLRPPSPAMVVATVALFVVLGGAAWAASGLKRNEVQTRNIAKKAVTAGKLATNAVKTPKLRNAAVTAVKLASNAVTTDALADSAVTKKKIKAQAVTTPKIGAGAVSDAKLAEGAVTGGKIADGSVDGAKLADGAVGAKKLAAGSVTSAAVQTAFTAPVDFGTLNAGDCERVAIEAPGVKQGDSVVLTGTSSSLSTILVNADAVTDEIGVTGCLISGGGDPNPINYRFLVIR